VMPLSPDDPSQAAAASVMSSPRSPSWASTVKTKKSKTAEASDFSKNKKARENTRLGEKFWNQQDAVKALPPQSPSQSVAAVLPAAVLPAMALPSQRSSESLACADLGKTTVMWRNLPNDYCRNSLVELLNSEGFAGSYDFFYSPVDFTSNALVGYAFVNLVSPEEANRFKEHFQGFTRWNVSSMKESRVDWSLQGLAVHIQRYRNSPVMHADVSDDKRPMLFKDGQRVPFPPSTKELRAPFLKDCRLKRA